MTQPTPDIHARFRENLETYLAGGLDADTAAELEAHLAACPECAAELATTRQADDALRSLFAAAAPKDDFEEKLIAGLRTPPTVRRIHPLVRYAATGVAAAVVLGAMGYYGGRLADANARGERFSLAVLRGPSADAVDRAKSASNLRQVGQAMQLYANENNYAFPTSFPDYSADMGPNTGAADARFRSPRALMAGANPASLQAKQTGWAWGDAQKDQSSGAHFGVVAGGERKPSQAAADMDFFYKSPPADADRAKQPAAPQFPAGEVANATSLNFYATTKTPNSVVNGRSIQLGIEPQKELADSAGKEQSAAQPPAQHGFGYFQPNTTMGRGWSANGDVTRETELARKPAALSKAIEAQDEKKVTDLAAVARNKDALDGARGDPALAKADALGVDKNGGAQAAKDSKLPEIRAGFALGDDAASTGLSVVKRPDPAAESQGVATPPSGTPATGPSTAASAAAAARKIIRTGTMDFEVDSFDSSFVQITKIAAEESGFVASTDSEKLPNGKVKGTVTLRCPPEHLDTLVLKLRGLGDLKTQRITAQDVTKQFTDFESQLKAARAMEERLLEIIKTGKGAVKDLVEAEKQLGVYREKIEQIEGELRYMGSQVALSTLNVSLTERDIRTPFAATEAEQVSAGIEAEDVEKARAEAIKAIDEAKGRVIESELHKLDAGQLAATLVAEVSPDAAGPLGDRLKQLGRVARWEATRKQTAQGGSGSPGQLPSNAKLERQPTRFSVSIYNLANVAPRQTTSLTLVATDVEAAYRAVLAAVNGDGKAPPIGRIVTSNLSAQKSDQVTGSVTLEVKSDQAPAIEAALRAAGSVLHLTVTENPDQNNVTSVKRGYGVTIIAAANVPAREQQTLAVASKDVQATYNKLLTLLRDPKQQARVTTSQLTEPQEDNVTGSVDFEIPAASRGVVDAVLSDGKQADVISRNVARSADAENTLADKLRMTVSIGSAERLPPRETTRLTLEAADVAKALDAAAGVGGSDARVTQRSLNQQPNGTAAARVSIDVPLSQAQSTLDQLRALGKVRAADSTRDSKVSAGPLARARFEVELENAETLVPPQEGIGASIQRGLKTALNGLLWSVQMVVVGLVLVLPFVLVIWGAWRLVRRGRRRNVPSAPTA